MTAAPLSRWKTATMKLSLWSPETSQKGRVAKGWGGRPHGDVAIHYRLDQLDHHVARDVVAELGQPLGPGSLRTLLHLAVDERDRWSD